jgi:hypothetical protein
LADDERRRPPGRREDYRYARIAVAFALGLTLMFLEVEDATSVDYEVQTTTLVTFGAIILGLLGLEVKDILRRE